MLLRLLKRNLEPSQGYFSFCIAVYVFVGSGEGDGISSVILVMFDISAYF